MIKIGDSIELIAGIVKWVVHKISNLTIVIDGIGWRFQSAKMSLIIDLLSSHSQQKMGNENVLAVSPSPANKGPVDANTNGCTRM